MKHLFTIAIIFLLASCSNKEKSVIVDKQDDIKTLTYLKEVEWPKAYREHDTLLLDRILADDFQSIDASGLWVTKEDEMNWIKENKTEHDSFFYEIKRLDIYENGTAVVAGTGHIINDSIETTYHSSNFFIKKDSLWKAISSHVSGIKQKPGN